MRPQHHKAVCTLTVSSLVPVLLAVLIPGVVGGFQDAVHITAILGESVVFNCQVEFPADHPVPYVLQWEKKVGDTVGYPTHTTFSISLSKHCAVRVWWRSSTPVTQSLRCSSLI
ncbi:hypothetical protein J6590_026002 [Homalodisca vitripennis]|nr:hypothetical protein J6590_026002 [Homalodisca vitripennis]